MTQILFTIPPDEITRRVADSQKLNSFPCRLTCPSRLVPPFFVMLRGCVTEVLIGALLEDWRISASRQRATGANAVSQIETRGSFNGVLRRSERLATRNLRFHHAAGCGSPKCLVVLLAPHRFIAYKIAASRRASS